MLAARLLNIYLFIWIVTPQASCPAIRLSAVRCPVVRLSQTTQSPLDLSTFTYHTHTRCFSRCVFSVFAFFGQLDAAINCSAK